MKDIHRNSKIKPVDPLSYLRKTDLLLLLVWPVGALIHAFRYYRWPSSRILFYYFCIFFGFAFIYADPYTGHADSARIAAQLILWHNKPIDIHELISLLYNPSTDTTDIYQALMTWIVSFFTGDPRWLFMLFAAIFGYFYSVNTWIILNRIDYEKSIVTIVYLIAFITINPIWNINGVRMNTAMQVFFYAFLNFFFLGSKRKLIWAIIAFLIHFSFVFPIFCLICYFILPRKTNLFFVAYLLGMAVNVIDLAMVRNFLAYVPDVFQSKINNYTSEAYLEALATQKTMINAHVVLIGEFEKWLIHFWVFLLYFTRRSWMRHSEILQNLFNFTLLFGALALVINLLPSGGRFLEFTKLLIYIYPIVLYNHFNKNRLVNNLMNLSLFPLVIIVLFKIRLGLDYIGIITLLGNPLIALFSDNQMPIIDLIKSLLTGG